MRRDNETWECAYSLVRNHSSLAESSCHLYRGPLALSEFSQQVVDVRHFSDLLLLVRQYTTLSRKCCDIGLLWRTRDRRKPLPRNCASKPLPLLRCQNLPLLLHIRASPVQYPKLGKLRRSCPLQRNLSTASPVWGERRAERLLIR